MLIKYYSTQAKKSTIQTQKCANAAVFASFWLRCGPLFCTYCVGKGMKPLPTNGLRYLRRVAALLAAGSVLAAGLLFALRAELPDTFVLEQGQPLAVESMPFLQAAPAVPAGSAAPAGVTAADKSANVTLTLLGLPVKTVRTVQQQRRTVQLGGTPLGSRCSRMGRWSLRSAISIPSMAARTRPKKRPAPGRPDHPGERHPGAHQ